MRDPITVETDGRRYVLRSPSIADVSSYKRAVRQAGGRNVQAGDLLILMESGLKEIAKTEGGEEAVAHGLSLVAEARERLLAFVNDWQGGAISNDEFLEAWAEAVRWSPDLFEVSNIVERHFRPYADAVADREVFAEISGRVALELFLTEAEGIAAPVKRGLDRLSDETLQAVPMADLSVVHRQFTDAVELAETEKKGSASRTSGEPGPKSLKGSSTRRKTSRSPNTKAGISGNGTLESSGSIPSGQPSPETMN